MSRDRYMASASAPTTRKVSTANSVTTSSTTCPGSLLKATISMPVEVGDILVTGVVETLAVSSNLIGQLLESPYSDCRLCRLPLLLKNDETVTVSLK